MVESCAASLAVSWSRPVIRFFRSSGWAVSAGSAAAMRSMAACRSAPLPSASCAKACRTSDSSPCAFAPAGPSDLARSSTLEYTESSSSGTTVSDSPSTAPGFSAGPVVYAGVSSTNRSLTGLGAIRTAFAPTGTLTLVGSDSTTSTYLAFGVIETISPLGTPRTATRLPGYRPGVAAKRAVIR